MAEILFETFIDLNILLFIAYATMCFGRKFLQVIGYHGAYRAQLTLTTSIMLTFLVIPLLLLGNSSLVQFSSPRVSDLLVSQFLDGNIGVTATSFASFLDFRTNFVGEILSPTMISTKIALSLVLLGFAYFLSRLIGSVRRICWIVGRSFSVRRVGRVKILSSDDIIVPFSARGLWHYYVVVPGPMFGNLNETKVALGHELQHIRQKDTEWEIFLELLRPFLFWNPAYWLVRSQIRTLREYACDQEFLDRTGFEPLAYSQCLFDVAQRATERARAAQNTGLLVQLIEPRTLWRPAGSSALARRIQAIGEPTGRRPTQIVMALFVLVFSVGFLFAAQSLQQSNGWSHDRIMLSTVINLERIHRVNAMSQPLSGN